MSLWVSMRKGVIALIAFALLTTGTAGAAPPPQPLSLEQAIDAALASNPQYRIASAGVSAAHAQVKQARAAFLPGIGLEYSYTYQNYVSELTTPFGALPFAPNETNVPLAALQYTLYDGGASVARFGAASDSLAAAEAARTSARNAIELQTSKAYFDLIAAMRGSDVADRAMALASAHAHLAQQRFDVGMIPRAELLAAQTDLADRQTQTIAAHNGVTLAQSTLDAAMNVSLGTLHAPTEPLEATVNPLNLDSLIASALAARPELAASNNAIGAANLALKAAGAQKLPHVNLTMSEGNAQPVLMTGYHGQFELGLQAVWTLFDGGYSDGAVDAARAAVDQSRLQMEALRTSIELEVRQTYANYTTAQAQIGAAERLVALADENQRLAEIRYRGGVGTALELRDAELRAISAAQQLINARVALRESLVAVRYAAGLLE